MATRAETVMTRAKTVTGLNEPHELRRLLGFQVQMAHLQMMSAARAALDAFGVTPARLTALLLIRANEGCDQSTLGRALSINRSSAMKLVNQLIDAALIERRSGRDLRSNALHLTPSGETRLDGMVAAVGAADVQAAATLSPDERATLCDLLSRVRANADQTDPLDD